MDIKNHGAEVSQVAKSKTQVTENHGKLVSEVANNKSAYASSKYLMNSAIISAQQEVSLRSSSEPLMLLYRAAIEAINEELVPTMGDNDLQTTVHDNGVDTSPEATADRIVSFATNFFSLYQDQNSNIELDEQLTSFMAIIGGAIDQGFDEAKEILTALQVLEGDIAAGVEQTYSLVQEGLLAFKERVSSDNGDAS